MPSYVSISGSRLSVVTAGDSASATLRGWAWAWGMGTDIYLGRRTTLGLHYQRIPPPSFDQRCVTIAGEERCMDLTGDEFDPFAYWSMHVSLGMYF